MREIFIILIESETINLNKEKIIINLKESLVISVHLN